MPVVSLARKAVMHPYTRKKDQNEDLPFIVGYAELLAWLRAQEEISASEFSRFVRQPVREILTLYDDLLAQVQRLQDAQIPPDARPGTGTILREVTGIFDPEQGLLKSPSPEDPVAFYDHAWKVCQRCESCFVEYSHLLVPAYADFVLALHSARDGIRREVGTLGPAVTEFRLMNDRIAKIRKLHAAIQKIDAETRIAMAKETLAAANIHTCQARLAAIGGSLATIETDPAGFAQQKQGELSRLKNEQDKLRTTFRRLALILADLTRRARGLAVRNHDGEAVQVLDRLTAVLEGEDIPDGDELFSALINGYPVLLDMMDAGDLTVSDETERYLFMDAATFNNGMRNLCKDYRAVSERIRSAAAGTRSTDARQAKEEYLREQHEIESLLRAETATRDDARALQETTATHRQTMARMIEDCLIEMTGRPARLRLNWPPSDAGEEPGKGEVS